MGMAKLSFFLYDLQKFVTNERNGISQLVDSRIPGRIEICNFHREITMLV